MTDFHAIADRVEIDALRAEYTDAGLLRDFDRFAALFTSDGVMRIPDAGIELAGRSEIRAGIERLQTVWEFFLQHTHAGALTVSGDTATGRAHMHELGRFRDGTSHVNYAIYHDRYTRTSDGWKFAERTYEIRYHDQTPLAGTPGGFYLAAHLAPNA
jgi:ketosteroid isomerase-like protein